MVYIPSISEFLDAGTILEKAGIGADMTVADFGCGSSGYFSIEAAKRVGKNGTIYAVDILKPTLEAVQSKARLIGLKNVKTVWANLEKYNSTKIPDYTVDVVLIKNMLWQSRNHAEVIKEAERILKPGGKILVVEWKKNASPVGPPIAHRVDRSEVEKLALQFNWKEVKYLDLGTYYYGLIFSK